MASSTNTSMQYENSTVVNFNSSAVVTPAPTNPPGMSTDGTSEFEIQQILGCCALLLGSVVIVVTVRWIVKAFHESANTVLCLNLLIHSWTLTNFRFF